jgi:hypothetical protein
MAVVLMVLLALSGCGKDDKTVASGDTTTTIEETTTTTEPPTTVPPSPTTAGKPLEVKEKKCAAGSVQDPQPPPDNWAQTWQTQPDTNQPMTMEICIDDVNPKVGQLVTLTVTADDPDASIGTDDCDIFVSWMSDHGSLCRDALVAPQGPEPTPAKEHGHVVKQYTHTYTKAQTYLVDVTAWSSDFNGHPHPYDNYSSAELHLSVHV